MSIKSWMFVKSIFSSHPQLTIWARDSSSRLHQRHTLFGNWNGLWVLILRHFALHLRIVLPWLGYNFDRYGCVWNELYFKSHVFDWEAHWVVRSSNANCLMLDFTVVLKSSLLIDLRRSSSISIPYMVDVRRTSLYQFFPQEDVSCSGINSIQGQFHQDLQCDAKMSTAFDVFHIWWAELLTQGIWNC